MVERRQLGWAVLFGAKDAKLSTYIEGGLPASTAPSSPGKAAPAWWDWDWDGCAQGRGSGAAWCENENGGNHPTGAASTPKYMDAFINAIKPKQRRAWSNKIKNRLKALVTKAREHITEMGETGAGIGAEDEILPGTALTTKWGEFGAYGSAKSTRHGSSTCGSSLRHAPNLQPVGLGNNDTQIDTSILIASHDGDDQFSIPDDTDFPDHLSEPAIDVLSSDSDDDSGEWGGGGGGGGGMCRDTVAQNSNRIIGVSAVSVLLKSIFLVGKQISDAPKLI
ncbi:hypothetical protein B0H10DRAFT_1959106 [Mycena sp. CBHHK59/15]|nr:hypothetical protein B0H10DRAFT_1959106 [Mycena sp. CBHHK59/15]